MTKHREDYIDMQIPSGFDFKRIVEAALQNDGIKDRFDLVERSLTDIFLELVGTSAF